MSILKRIKEFFKKEEKTYIGTVIIKEKKYNFYNYEIENYYKQTIKLTIDDYVDWDSAQRDTAIIHFKDKYLDSITIDMYPTINLFVNTKLYIKNSECWFPASPSELMYTRLELSLKDK